jgi:transglutaminase-like putative cysteine protease
MTEYVVRHRTTYKYGRDVAFSRLVAHLSPRTTPLQQTRDYELTIAPTPIHAFSRLDYFGNRTDWFTIDGAHDVLDVLAESRVTVADRIAFEADAGPSWESVRAAIESPSDGAALDAVQYAFDTQLTAVTAEVVAYARPSFGRDRSLLACVRDLNSRIYRDFKYDGEATDTTTSVARAIELRAGVCQDFAHVGVACMRAMGLAARYVSGYLLTHPPPGRERLVGADASHAWFSAWIPTLGWVDFDPTNDVLPGREHITTAWGRDFADVSPIHGIVTGGSASEIDVAVDVIPLAS